MSRTPDDEVELEKLILPAHGESMLLEFFEVGEMPLAQALVAIPFRDLAHDLHLALVPGGLKDDALKALLEARNKAARAIFDQTN